MIEILTMRNSMEQEQDITKHSHYIEIDREVCITP